MTVEDRTIEKQEGFTSLNEIISIVKSDKFIEQLKCQNFSSTVLVSTKEEGEAKNYVILKHPNAKIVSSDINIVIEKKINGNVCSSCEDYIPMGELILQVNNTSETNEITLCVDCIKKNIESSYGVTKRILKPSVMVEGIQYSDTFRKRLKKEIRAYLKSNSYTAKEVDRTLKELFDLPNTVDKVVMCRQKKQCFYCDATIVKNDSHFTYEWQSMEFRGKRRRVVRSKEAVCSHCFETTHEEWQSKRNVMLGD